MIRPMVEGVIIGCIASGISLIIFPDHTVVDISLGLVLMLTLILGGVSLLNRWRP